MASGLETTFKITSQRERKFSNLSFKFLLLREKREFLPQRVTKLWSSFVYLYVPFAVKSLSACPS